MGPSYCYAIRFSGFYFTKVDLESIISAIFFRCNDLEFAVGFYFGNVGMFFTVFLEEVVVIIVYNSGFYFVFVISNVIDIGVSAFIPFLESVDGNLVIGCRTGAFTYEDNCFGIYFFVIITEDVEVGIDTIGLRQSSQLPLAKSSF